MRPEASNRFTVHCDICQEAMRECAMAGAGHSSFFCYPCNNVIYESDLWQYEGAIRHEVEVDVPQGA